MSDHHFRPPKSFGMVPLLLYGIQGAIRKFPGDKAKLQSRVTFS